jgi:hypothetical protein
VDQRAVGHELAPTHEPRWIPVATVAKLRDVTARYLDGDRNLTAEIESIAFAVARAAHEGNHTPERMLIAVRELWREFARSQHDRLQLAALYDRLVRRTIDRYYDARIEGVLDGRR